MPLPVVAAGTGTATLLARLATPYDPALAAATMLGLPHRAGRQLVGIVLATSEEATALLDAMPRILRSLSIATTDRPQRVHGELRGPVLWSETMSARSASAGDTGLFVCATPSRAYDTDENRILKAALHRIDRAGVEAGHGVDDQSDSAVQEAHQNGNHARRALAHRTLSGVPLVRVSGRALRRTRAGRRRGTYWPALALLARSQHPLRADHLRAYASRSIAADHDLLATALAALDVRTGAPVALHLARGALTAGPIRYRQQEGLTIGGVLVTSGEDAAAALEPTPS
ncbi:MAG: hypothetical protein WD691_01940 [Acidimicrobiales bacterium]